MTANAEQHAEMHAQRSNVCARFARHPEHAEVSIVVKLEQLALVDRTNTQATFHTGNHRWSLKQRTSKRFNCLKQQQQKTIKKPKKKVFRFSFFSFHLLEIIFLEILKHHVIVQQQRILFLLLVVIFQITKENKKESRFSGKQKKKKKRERKINKILLDKSSGSINTNDQ